MAGQVIWSPNVEDEFVTYGNELKLYQIQSRQDSKDATTVNLSEDHVGRLIAASSDISCLSRNQTVAWQPSKDHAHFFAIGQSNGKVSLTNLLSPDPAISLLNVQLIPKTLGRPCHCVVWNPSDNRLLAEGLEKTRADSSLIVWDVTRAGTSTPNKTKHSKSNFTDAQSPSEDPAKYFETGHGENTSSIAWLPSRNNCLIAGMGRFLKIFDTRAEVGSLQSCPPREYAQHKAIYGLTVDPISSHQIASYAEGNTVYLWDIRSFQRPMYSFTRPGHVLHLSWMPTRPGCLSLILSEAPYLRLINIPFLSQTQDAGETYMDYLNNHINDRYPISGPGALNKPLSSLQWHSEWYNTGLVINNEGVVKELTVHDKMPITWSSHDSMVFAVNDQMRSVEYAKKSEDVKIEEDISTIMMDRVKRNYGFNAAKNVVLLGDSPSLCRVWNWLSKQSGSNLSDVSKLDRGKRISGVNSVSGSLSTSSQTPPSSSSPPFPTYSNPQRTVALELCGWGFSNNQKLEDFLKSEETAERFERAAAIAVFQGDIGRAIGSLKDGALTATRHGDMLQGSLLNLIALSLSGYSSSEPSLWQETCVMIRKQISHPYLRAMFSFLCAGTSVDGLYTVLMDSELTLQDRVAFACTYLNDKNLKDYLAKLTKKVVEEGYIEGLFLTGLDASGIQLLENYVNKTGDVQSACLIAGQTLSILSKAKPSVSAWFEGYRDLLDQWQMWKERALFDHERKLLDPSHKPVRQAAVLCTFCSKAISNDILRQEGMKSLSKKSTSCPSCRKPLPRCALCLLHMVAGISKGRDHSSTNQSDQFGQWFTWCQTCRHGGHAAHLAEWFESHEVCPVSDCMCYCISLDL